MPSSNDRITGNEVKTYHIVRQASDCAAAQRLLGLINNLVGVMIIHAARFATFSTFLLRSYMVTIPRDFPHHRTDHQARNPDRGDMGFLTGGLGVGRTL